MRFLQDSVRLFLALWLATAPVYAGSMTLLGAGKPAAAGGGCSQATTFLARTSGLSGTESSAYTTMICGMVTDGTWSLMDAVYIFATNTTTTAALNLVSTSFPATTNGTWTFTADRGWAGNGGATDIIGTAYIPSTAAGNLTLNSSSIGVYNRTSRTVSTFADIGAQNQGGSSILWLIPAGTSAYYDNNEASLTTAVVSNAQGMWVSTRTGAGSYSVFQSPSTTTPLATNSVASVSLVNNEMYIGATHDSTLAVFPNGGAFISTDQIAAAFIGGGLTNAQALSVSNRINAYMTSVGANVY